jgi:hypothetical protein
MTMAWNTRQTLEILESCKVKARSQTPIGTRFSGPMVWTLCVRCRACVSALGQLTDTLVVFVITIAFTIALEKAVSTTRPSSIMSPFLYEERFHILHWIAREAERKVRRHFRLVCIVFTIQCTVRKERQEMTKSTATEIGRMSMFIQLTSRFITESPY